jgi:hypothetical protein
MRLPVLPFRSAALPTATPRMAHLALLAGLTLSASAIDLAGAFAYWSLLGVAPGQVLRAIASWVLGPLPPDTAAVMAVGVGVHLAIYAGMVAVLDALLPARQARPEGVFRVGAIYGTLVYVVVYQLVVPQLAPSASHHSVPWVATCVVLHALVIGPALAAALQRWR